jgi:hypothetical protein
MRPRLKVTKCGLVWRLHRTTTNYKVKFTLEHTMKIEGEGRDTVYPFFKLNARLRQMDSDTPRPLYSGRSHGIYGAGGWVDLGNEMGGCEKSRPPPHPHPNRVQTPNRPARSESPCQLSYTGRQDYYRCVAIWTTAILVKVFRWSKKTRRFSRNLQIPR